MCAGWISYDGINAIKNGSIGGPGETLDRLNREILEGEKIGLVGADSTDENGSVDDAIKSADDKDNLFATLFDQNQQSSNVGKTIAIFLPLALTACLAVSYELIVAGSANKAAVDVTGENMWSDIQSLISSYLPYLTTLPSLALCLLFACAEFRWVFPSKDSLATTSTNEPLLCAGNIMALSYLMGAYLAKAYPTIVLNEHTTTSTSLDLWPFQDGVNIALATSVTRALAPFLVPTSLSSKKSIRTIALALIGVTLFDGISVFGAVANAAAIDNAPESSVMEVVACSKLASQSSNLAAPWQPGKCA